MCLPFGELLDLLDGVRDDSLGHWNVGIDLSALNEPSGRMVTQMLKYCEDWLLVSTHNGGVQGFRDV